MKEHLTKAIEQIGVEEVPRGSNWGKDLNAGVPMYLKSVGIDFPASWCMAFVYWCVEAAKVRIDMGQGAGLRNPLVKTGGVLKQWQQVETQFRQPKCKFEKPEVGDIFIMDFGHGVGHTGFVESLDPDGIHINTVEGNTNDEGSREGYEVCRRRRLITKCVGFIRV